MPWIALTVYWDGVGAECPGTFLGTNNLLKSVQTSRLLAEDGKDPAPPWIHHLVSTMVLSSNFLVDTSGSPW